MVDALDKTCRNAGSWGTRLTGLSTNQCMQRRLSSLCQVRPLEPAQRYFQYKTRWSSASA